MTLKSFLKKETNIQEKADSAFQQNLTSKKTTHDQAQAVTKGQRA
jgi:hypothetical protein